MVCHLASQPVHAAMKAAATLAKFASPFFFFFFWNFWFHVAPTVEFNLIHSDFIHSERPAGHCVSNNGQSELQKPPQKANSETELRLSTLVAGVNLVFLPIVSSRRERK